VCAGCHGLLLLLLLLPSVPQVGDVEQPTVRRSDQLPAGISAGLQGGTTDTLHSSMASSTSQQQQHHHVQLQPPRRRWNDSWRR
jgi:hypothetical protein